MTKYEIYEVMKLPSDDSVSLINSLNILMKNVEVKLLNNSKNELYYKIDINDIILSKLTIDDLIKVRNGNWILTQDKKNIIKKI